jgi:hypothetical protein
MAPATKPSSVKSPSKDTRKARFGRGQPSNYCGKKGRSGPRSQNQNALRHGLKAGQLPKDAKYIEYRLNAFRRTLEQAVLSARGEVNIPDAAYIQTCLRWERHACLAQRWLVKAGDTLKPEQRLTFSREIARASAERDKAIAALKLDRDARDNAIDALYARLPAPTDNGESNDGPS